MSEILWTTGVTADGKVFLEDNNFTHDVRLYVNGDFVSLDDKINFAYKLARKLNGTLDDRPSGTTL
jgi:hypothetical protein